MTQKHCRPPQFHSSYNQHLCLPGFNCHILMSGFPGGNTMVWFHELYPPNYITCEWTSLPILTLTKNHYDMHSTWQSATRPHLWSHHPNWCFPCHAIQHTALPPKFRQTLPIFLCQHFLPYFFQKHSRNNILTHKLVFKPMACYTSFPMDV